MYNILYISMAKSGWKILEEKYLRSQNPFFSFGIAEQFVTGAKYSIGRTFVNHSGEVDFIASHTQQYIHRPFLKSHSSTAPSTL